MKKINDYIKEFIKNPLSIILFLLFFFEGLYKCFIQLGIENIKISALLKIALQSFFIYYILKNKPKKIIPIIIIILIFLTGQINFITNEGFILNLLFLDKYLFLILALMYVNTLKDRNKYYNNFFKTFEYIIIFNSLLIFLGFCFYLNLFKTYPGNREGFSGLILRSGAASYIYWIAIFYFSHQVFILKCKKIIPLLIVFSSSLFLGTKSIILAIAFIPVLLFFTFKFYNNKNYLILFSGLLITGVLLFKTMFNFFAKYTNSLDKVFENHDFATAFFSLRNLRLLEDTLPLIKEKWTVVNYLFGGGFDMHMRSQFGIFDMLFFLGILGTIYYLYIFLKEFITYRLNTTTIVFLIGTFVLMFLGGNFFYETIIAFYLIFIKSYFEEYY